MNDVAYEIAKYIANAGYGTLGTDVLLVKYHQIKTAYT